MTPQTKPHMRLPALETDPAIILFGHDDSGKPHASSFNIDRRHDAIKAASLMGFQALAVEGDILIALAAQIPVGKVFSSGKGFVPFVKREVGAQLDQFAKDHPNQLITLPTPVAAASGDATANAGADQSAPALVTNLPKDWLSITVGSRVLAVDDPDDGWWEAVVQKVHESGTKGHPCPMLTLVWETFPDEDSFVRRFDDVALMHPSKASAAPDGTVDGA